MKFNLRNVIFGIIIILCIIAVSFAIYWQFFKNINIENSTTNTIKEDLNTEELAKNFKDIFENKLNYQGNNININGLTKVDSTKDLIYTLYTRKEVVDNKYDMNMQVPYINIINDSIEKFNKQIDDIFVDKARNIITQATNNTIYSVEYMGYINTNILSLVIKSTLKEGNNPQRVIIQTYNYNLSTNEVMSLNQVLEIQGLQKQNVENKIKNVVQAANNEAISLKELGYNVFIRDIDSDIYKSENITNFFIGENNKLYIVYSYGNSNFTSAMDVIVF